MYLGIFVENSFDVGNIVLFIPEIYVFIFFTNFEVVEILSSLILLIKFSCFYWSMETFWLLTAYLNGTLWATEGGYKLGH